MRTTVDIDPVVMSAARTKARAEGISLGRAISELALRGLQGAAVPSKSVGGFPVMSGVEGHVVTDDLVAAHRDDDQGDE
ncbi:DUF2191 domain-containing protein [Tsukamurella spumae]|uniref:DUF2191 domain-containing protein n=1 Tax=Tsukamurella spumae TaxID=44753 RepID=A0A846WY64_9ACTN|nr:DUF2191 domain-containing protein [Tsukamurella spumae]